MAGTKLILMSRPGLMAPFEPERLPISRLSNNPPPVMASAAPAPEAPATQSPGAATPSPATKVSRAPNSN
ncbi:hypothetical protein SNOG_04715 [Parastagonospora nodorum SN15]|uniref:Uncharacterized protein n=2 Tax=Phaeosphaeria nodorum (strain SN15 / ATCC MYA-4574 / FGSC 10173) TaxID=321614 RepID=Q0UU49_PHANO|nr:hypothetical protein SNOG_04715 [Parastagonospora nodorum SN15]KAH4377156.1 hypothetical protein HBH99_207290 [Parastagonospora nodorum]EAT88475.1 hypothetical protein SNOG_04715 [Parastagonospora nodorum SN15]KAH4405902.1 hypothetical protein HBH92_171860 [Parastagonospora nodorum]KAH4562256.1 hypothetical protein HBH86_054590 [Parastagonospora nodorum]KAH4583438.1 hypothetical protein HBH84_024550 [Parastagonospora nodorum]